MSAVLAKEIVGPTVANASADDDILTVSEAASLLRVGRNQLYEAIGRGAIPHLRIGRTIRLSRGALVRCFARSCGAASPKE